MYLICGGQRLLTELILLFAPNYASRPVNKSLEIFVNLHALPVAATIDEMVANPFMRLALRLARRGYGLTSPNPMVGAVLVKGGKIIGRGWHRQASFV